MIVLEYRDYCFDCGKTIDSDIVQLFSTKEKAIEFIKANTNYNLREKLWWWATYSIEVDKKIEFDDLEFYSKSGELLEKQP